MSQSLVELATSIRAAESVEEEREIISCEQAEMRTYSGPAIRSSGLASS
jgi:hypothetical protein